MHQLNLHAETGIEFENHNNAILSSNWLARKFVIEFSRSKLAKQPVWYRIAYDTTSPYSSSKDSYKKELQFQGPFLPLKIREITWQKIVYFFF